MITPNTMPLWDETQHEPLLETVVRLSPPAPALDLGAGLGRDSLFLGRHGFEVTAVDHDETSLKKLRLLSKQETTPLSFVHEDIRKYEPKNLFNVVICDMVLHFFTHKEILAMIAKMQRLTVPGGMNVVVAYSDKNEPGKRPYLFGHNELRDRYLGWQIISYDEKPTPWFVKPGETEPRQNQAAYLLAQKIR